MANCEALRGIITEAAPSLQSWEAYAMRDLLHPSLKRVFQIVGILSDREWHFYDDIANDLSVHPNTVKQTIQELIKVGFPIERDVERINDAGAPAAIVKLGTEYARTYLEYREQELELN